MLASLWEKFLKNLSQKSKEEKTPIIYSILKQLHPIELTEKKLVLSCENQGFVFFLQKKIPQIEKYVSEYFEKKLRVEVIVVERKRKASAPLLHFEPTVEDLFRKSGLNTKYSFENFAVSSSNQVAYAAAQAVAEDVGKAYNPLFFYGGVGVGKTHLAQAIARRVLERKPSKKVLFSPGDLFTNELIEAIRERSTQRFRRKYRHLDLLIVDDVQFIAGKNSVQEEFFHTFNAIVSAGGQIILTSDRPPREIKSLEDRLRSRFSGGLIVDIQRPDFELRSAILLIKAQEKSIEIDLEVAKLIAEQISDTRALEGTLLTLYAKTLHNGEKIGVDVVESFFDNHQEKKQKRLDPSTIIKAICSYYNIKQSYLKGPSRAENIALPRQVAMFLLRSELRLKLDEIAFLLKRKDHTTIMHGVEKISGLLARNPAFKEEVDRVVNSLIPSTDYSH